MGAAPNDDRRGAAYGIAAMVLVGSSAAVLVGLDDYPTFAGQGLRYAGASVALLLLCRIRRVRHLRLSRSELLRLVLLAATGLAGFNVCFMQAVRYADPSSVGAIIGGVPVVMALVDPLVRKVPPNGRIVTAAAVVTVGVVITQGFGGGSVPGLLWALGALAGEVAFSLLAVPVLPRLGPLRVATYSAGLAVPLLLATAVVVGGRDAVPMPNPAELLTLVYLAVFVTAVAFVLWYSAVHLLGADRAGLCAGIAPASTVVASLALGTGDPGVADVLGCLVVGIGVVLGLRTPRVPIADRVG